MEILLAIFIILALLSELLEAIMRNWWKILIGLTCFFIIIAGFTYGPAWILKWKVERDQESKQSAVYKLANETNQYLIPMIHALEEDIEYAQNQLDKTYERLEEFPEHSQQLTTHITRWKQNSEMLRNTHNQVIFELEAAYLEYLHLEGLGGEGFKRKCQQLEEKARNALELSGQLHKSLSEMTQ